MKVLIKVTKDVLKQAMYCGGSTTGCAIAIAIREIFPNAAVTTTTIHPGLPQRCGVIDLPIEATEFINEFDSSTPEQRLLMRELQFSIDVHERVINHINISHVYKVLSESKTLEYEFNS